MKSKRNQHLSHWGGQPEGPEDPHTQTRTSYFHGLCHRKPLHSIPYSAGESFNLHLSLDVRHRWPSEDPESDSVPSRDNEVPQPALSNGLILLLSSGSREVLRSLAGPHWPWWTEIHVSGKMINGIIFLMKTLGMSRMSDIIIKKSLLHSCHDCLKENLIISLSRT